MSRRRNVLKAVLTVNTALLTQNASTLIRADLPFGFIRLIKMYDIIQMGSVPLQRVLFKVKKAVTCFSLEQDKTCVSVCMYMHRCI